MDQNLDLSKFNPHQQQLILQHLAITNQQVKAAKENCPGYHRKDCSHIPCKFFMVGTCQAGKTCPFSHDAYVIEKAFHMPCKYYMKGTCKFGDRCINAHIEKEPTSYKLQSVPRSMNDTQAVSFLSKQFLEVEKANQSMISSSAYQLQNQFNPSSTQNNR